MSWSEVSLNHVFYGSFKTFLHNKSLNDCKHFMLSKSRSHKSCQKLFHRYFTFWFTLSYASSCLFNSREKPLYDNINTSLEKNEKHSQENLFIYLYKNGFIHKNILGKLMSWTVYNCFELSCFQSRGG